MLIIGGGGAVGYAATQLAVAIGCKVATTCGPQSVDRLLAAGAEQAVDYTSEVLEFSLYDLLYCFSLIHEEELHLNLYLYSLCLHQLHSSRTQSSYC